MINFLTELPHCDGRQRAHSAPATTRGASAMQPDNSASANNGPSNSATLSTCTEDPGMTEEHTDGNRDVEELPRVRSAEAALMLTTPVNAVDVTEDADDG